MPNFRNHEEDSDWDDDEPLDEEADEESGTLSCPACGADIYEDAPQCPVCGEYVTRSSRSIWVDRPGWYVLLAGLGIGAVILAMLFAQ